MAEGKKNIFFPPSTTNHSYEFWDSAPATEGLGGKKPTKTISFAFWFIIRAKKKDARLLIYVQSPPRPRSVKLF